MLTSSFHAAAAAGDRGRLKMCNGRFILSMTLNLNRPEGAAGGPCGPARATGAALVALALTGEGHGPWAGTGGPMLTQLSVTALLTFSTVAGDAFVFWTQQISCWFLLLVYHATFP